MTDLIYVLTPYIQGVLNNYFAPLENEAQPIPVDLLVTGSVPAGSGLSSSAAMVVASTLVFLAVNDKVCTGVHAVFSFINLQWMQIEDAALTKGKLVEIAVENEKRVGMSLN